MYQVQLSENMHYTLKLVSKLVRAFHPARRKSKILSQSMLKKLGYVPVATYITGLFYIEVMFHL